MCPAESLSCQCLFADSQVLGSFHLRETERELCFVIWQLNTEEKSVLCCMFDFSACSSLNLPLSLFPSSSQAHGSGRFEELDLLAESKRRCHSVCRAGFRHVQSTSQTAMIRPPKACDSNFLPRFLCPPRPPPSPPRPSHLKNYRLTDQPTNQPANQAHCLCPASSRAPPPFAIRARTNEQNHRCILYIFENEECHSFAIQFILFVCHQGKESGLFLTCSSVKLTAAHFGIHWYRLVQVTH